MISGSCGFSRLTLEGISISAGCTGHKGRQELERGRAWLHVPWVLSFPHLVSTFQIPCLGMCEKKPFSPSPQPTLCAPSLDLWLTDLKQERTLGKKHQSKVDLTIALLSWTRCFLEVKNYFPFKTLLYSTFTTVHDVQQLLKYWYLYVFMVHERERWNINDTFSVCGNFFLYSFLIPHFRLTTS
jgi:hypothetical protein